jgi:hypothetical protein
MPSEQRRWRDDEGLPTRTRQESAGRGEEQPVNSGDCGTARLAPQDREFVSQHDDFEFLELRRSHAQRHELEKPAEHQVAQRHEHKAPRERGYGPILRTPDWFRIGWQSRQNLCTLQA